MTTQTAARPARTSALIENGSAIYATGGAVNQDGLLKMYTCNACGSTVVWATSAKTGRKYLVNVVRGYHGQRFYMKNLIHKCNKEHTS